MVKIGESHPDAFVQKHFGIGGVSLKWRTSMLALVVLNGGNMNACKSLFGKIIRLWELYFPMKFKRLKRFSKSSRS